MPKLRDRSKLRQTIQFASVPTTCYKKWTTREKKTMVKALKKREDICDDIHKNFPGRTEGDVKAYVRTRRRLARDLVQKEKNVHEKKDDETWVGLVDKLLEDIPDYTYTFEEIFHEFQSEFKKPKTPKKNKASSSSEPNWNVIYEYIAMLFSGEELPHLGQIEAGIMLMQIEDMLDYYNSMNTTEQLHLCTVKRKLLRSIVAAEKNDSTPEDRQRIVDTMLNLNIMRTCQDLNSTSSSQPTNHSTFDSSALSALNATKDEDSQSTIISEVVVVQNEKSKQDEPLYSINPLSIPISFLNPKPK